MKRFVILCLGLLFGATTRAQELSFPTIDPQALGMGGVTMTSVSGAHALYNNAAAAAFSLAPIKISTSYYGQSDFDYYAVSGHLRLGRNSLIQAGWRQFLREKGNHDSALDLGYTHRFGNRLAVGIVGRYMHLKRYDTEQSDALAVDLSLAWQKQMLGWGRFSILRSGVKIGNLGGFLDNSDYKLPMDVKAGVALETFFSDAHQLTVGVDAGYYFTPSAIRGFQAAAGIEYNLMQLIQLRAGYHLGERKAYYPSFASLGAGLRLLHIRVDFAYLLAERNTLLRNTYSISFGLDF